MAHDLEGLTAVNVLKRSDIIGALKDGFSEDECEVVKDFLAGTNGYDIFIHEDHFKTYAQELAEDIFSIDIDMWPANCIDWDEAVAELQQDYMEFELNGVTFFAKEE